MRDCTHIKPILTNILFAPRPLSSTNDVRSLKRTLFGQRNSHCRKTLGQTRMAVTEASQKLKAKNSLELSQERELLTPVGVQ